MAVNTLTNRVQYNGDGIVTSHSVPFKFFDNSWIYAILTDSSGNDTSWTEGVDYTLTGSNVEAGGTLIATTAPASGERLTIYREAPYSQLTTYEFNGAFPSDANEDTVDKNLILIQQVRDIADVLAIRYPQSEPSTTTSILPDTATRKGKYLYFSATDGSPTVAVPTGVGVTLLDEDNMVSDSDTEGATQQSIKAYVDAQVAGGDVSGPASAVDENFARFNGTTGKVLEDSLIGFIDEDSMATDSATKVPSQQSVKAYTDAHLLDEDDFASDSATKPPSQQSTKAYITAQVGVGGIFDDYFAGFDMSNNGTDASHDIDIATGAAMDSTNAKLIRLTSGLTKQIDAVWAEGTNAGWLDTGTVANDSTYWAYAIIKTDGTIDSVCSLDPNTPTSLPSGYAEYINIGPIMTDGSANIIPFRQDANYFDWDDEPSAADHSTTPSIGVVTTATLRIPLGKKLRAVVSVEGTGSNSTTKFWDPDTTDRTSNSTIQSDFGTSTAGASGELNITTNTSSQIKFITGGGSAMRISAKGFFYNRGK